MPVTDDHRNYVLRVYNACVGAGRCSTLSGFVQMFLGDALAPATRGAYGSSWTGNETTQHRAAADSHLTSAWGKISQLGADLKVPYSGDPPAAAIAMRVVLAAAPSAILTRLLLGVPGTGKTYHARKMHEALNCASPTVLTMHAATSYEEFVEGLRPTGTVPQAEERGTDVRVFKGENDITELTMLCRIAGEGNFHVRDGTFLNACRLAARNPNKRHVIVLDEFNRCNVPKVMGELLSALEPSCRAQWNNNRWDVSNAMVVKLPYSQRSFFIPENLIVVATMNTSDRSIAPLDAAVLRRFAVERVWPLGFEGGEFNEHPELDTLKGVDGLSSSVEAWVALNRLLRERYGPDAMIGHSYLFDMGKGLAGEDRRFYREADPMETVKWYWNRTILPQVADILESMNAFGDLGENSELTKGLRGAFGQPLDLGVDVLGDNPLQRRIHLWLT